MDTLLHPFQHQSLVHLAWNLGGLLVVAWIWRLISRQGLVQLSGWLLLALCAYLLLFWAAHGLDARGEIFRGEYYGLSGPLHALFVILALARQDLGLPALSRRSQRMFLLLALFGMALKLGVELLILAPEQAQRGAEPRIAYELHALGALAGLLAGGGVVLGRWLRAARAS